MPLNETFLRADESQYPSLFDIDIVIDDALAKIIYVNFENYGFVNISSTPATPVNISSLLISGNYNLYDYTGGPPTLPVIQPLRLMVGKYETQVIQCVIHMLDIYFRYGTDVDGVVTFGEWQTQINYSGTLYCGGVEPVSPNPTDLWVDTSVSLFPVIRIYSSVDGWIGVGSTIDNMNANVYDTTGIREDVFLYFEKKFGIPNVAVNPNNYVTFFNLRAKMLSHMVSMGHVTQDERELINSMISITEVNNEVTRATTAILDYLNERIAQMKLDVLHLKVTADNTTFNTHYAKHHPDQALRNYWDAKSNPDHNHNLDENVTISAEDITEGVISLDIMPDGAINILKRVLTHEARFALTREQVQNGDSVHVSEETDRYESGLYLVYNDLHLDTDEGYIYYRSRRLANIDYQDIDRKPSTLTGYGITNGIQVIKTDPNQTFQYPYQNNDSSLNYVLTKANESLHAYITNILDNIESAMKTSDIAGIKSLVEDNYSKYLTINTQWEPNRLVNGNQVPVRHANNKALYDETEQLYTDYYTLFLG